MKRITTLSELETHYGTPNQHALWKEIDHINPHYRQFIEQSPFVIIATYGDNGVDCSPRGDPPGFVHVVDKNTLHIPDRRGNNRLDSLKNIINNPGVGLIFLIPGIGESIRVSGTASIVIDEALCQRYAIKSKPASSVITVNVNKAYFQCQKAIARSQLWEHTRQLERSQLPSTGDMLKTLAPPQNPDFDSQAYDNGYTDYMKKTIY